MRNELEMTGKLLRNVFNTKESLKNLIVTKDGNYFNHHSFQVSNIPDFSLADIDYQITPKIV
jgi:hypothetical protein